MGARRARFELLAQFDRLVVIEQLDSHAACAGVARIHLQHALAGVLYIAFDFQIDAGSGGTVQWNTESPGVAISWPGSYSLEESDAHFSHLHIDRGSAKRTRHGIDFE
ncbi:hypothetical protein D9M71_671480 [compost metagenome]